MQDSTSSNAASLASRSISVVRLPLRVNFSWMLAGNVVHALCHGGIFVVLSQAGSTEMVGLFALGLAVTAPVMALANLALEQAQVTDVRHDFVFGDYLGLRIMTTSIALIVVVGIADLMGYEHETVLVVIAVGAFKAFQALSDVFFGFLQKHERMDRIGLSLIIKGVLSLAVFGATIYYTDSLLAAIIVMGFSYGVMLLGYDIPNARKLSERIKRSCNQDFPLDRRLLSSISLKPRWKFKILMQLAWLALPLAMTSALLALNTNLPRYFIEKFVGVGELGVFAALAYLMIAGRLVTGALGRSVVPRMAKLYVARNRRAFVRLLAKLLVSTISCGLIGIIVSILFGEQLLTFVYSAEYARLDVFLILIVAATIQYGTGFTSAAVLAARWFRVQPLILTVVTGATLLACFFLIPNYGILGGSLALLIGATVRAIGYLIVLYWVVQSIDGCSSIAAEKS